MKKLFILLIFLSAALGSQAQTKAKKGLQVGNTSGVVRIDSITSNDTIIRFYHGGTRITESDVIGDSIQKVFDDAEDADDWFDAKIADFTGTGGGQSWDMWQYIIGTTTGAPANGDSTFTDSDLMGKEVELYRGSGTNLYKQRQNNTATNGITGFRFASSTGTITTRPTFSTGETVQIKATDPVNVTWHTISGSESSLMDSLKLWYQLNETTGTTITDVMGNYNATASGVTLGGAGKFGNAVIYDAAADRITGPSTGLEFSNLTISIWVRTNNTPVDDPVGLITKRITGPNRGFSVAQMETNNIVFYIFNSTYGYGALFTETTIADNTWHNIVCTYDGSNLRVRIDGVEDNYSPEAWTHVPDYAVGATPFYLGNSVYGTDGFIGSIDAVGIWNRVLTSDEITELQTKTYPFN